MSAPRHERVDIALGERSYPILIGAGLLEDAQLLSTHISARSLLIVTNETIAPLYLAKLQGALQGRRIATLILPDGEQHKTLENFSRILDALVAERMNRDAAAVALGGGVIGDMVGFAAACYQRGIDYVQVPTTLLAQVDSSVGGKTGVNHPRGKNMIGAFHQPRCVLADTSTLQTLSPREYRAGLAEVIKYGFIRDVAFLQWLETNAERLRRARGCRSDSRGPSLLRDQSGRGRPGRARARSARDSESRPHVRARDRDGVGLWQLAARRSGGCRHGHGRRNVGATGLAATGRARPRRAAAQARSACRPTPPRIGAQRGRELMGMDKKVLGGRIRLVLLKELGHAVVVDDYAEQALDATLQAHFG